MKQKPLLLTVLSTVVFAIAAYFGYSPDLQAADTIGTGVGQAAEAISTRNYLLAGSVIVNLLIWGYNYWRK